MLFYSELQNFYFCFRNYEYYFVLQKRLNEAADLRINLSILIGRYFEMFFKGIIKILAG